jgi:site-specific recombinase XerD
MSKIKLQFVQAYRDVRGKPRHYYRRNGRRVPLPGLPGSAEFMAAYAAAHAGGAPAEIGASRTLPGSMSALVVAYYKSAEFKHEIGEDTRRNRRGYIEKFREQYGDGNVATLKTEHIRSILAKIEKPHVRKNWLKAIRSLMSHAVTIGMRQDDPTLAIKVKTPKTDGFKAWDEEAITAFRATHAVGTRARLALELLLNTGQRRGDVVRMGRQHLRMRGQKLMITVRQNKGGKVLDLPVLPELRAVIDGTPAEHLTFLAAAGKPFSVGGFSHWFRQVCNEAGLPALAAHGLRKATARRLAEAGCSEHEIAAITGHASLREIAIYTATARQTLLAQNAMDRLGEKRTNRH